MKLEQGARADDATIKALAELRTGKSGMKRLSTNERKAIKGLIVNEAIPAKSMPEAIHTLLELNDTPEVVRAFDRVAKLLSDSGLSDLSPDAIVAQFVPMVNRDRLREQMDKMRLTATEVAKLAGISSATVSSYLHGASRLLGTKNCLRFARAIGDTPTWLCEGMSGEHAIAFLAEYTKAHPAFEKTEVIGDVEPEVDPFLADEASETLLSVMLDGVLAEPILTRLRELEGLADAKLRVLEVQSQVIEQQTSLIKTLEEAVREFGKRR